MPFPMKIQPIDSQTYRESIRNDAAAAAVKPVLKSRLKRLFDRQFPSVLRISSATEKPVAPVGAQHGGKDGEFEPSSVCLAKMVQNFIEETTPEKQSVKCGRNRCNCFNGNNNDSSDDELDLSTGFFNDSVPNAWSGDACDTLKSLIPCASVNERNILADTSKIVEKNKNCKRKDELIKFVIDGLLFLGHDASICKSRWEKSSSFPAGEYEYIEVIVEGDRVLIDIDFRSEFEIARSTVNYKTILQSLPHIFVGKADRLQQILLIVSEAAKQSLKKKGMHLPPWRKVEYMRSKWLSPHTRTTAIPPPATDAVKEIDNCADIQQSSIPLESDCGDFELIFGEKLTSSETEIIGNGDTGFLPVTVNSSEIGKSPSSTSTWEPPAVKPKCGERGTKVVVTGLASLFKERA